MLLHFRRPKKVVCYNQAASINEKGRNYSEVSGARRETAVAPMSRIFGFGSFTDDLGSPRSCHGPHREREDFLVLLHSWIRKVCAQSCGAVDAASSLGRGAQLGSPFYIVNVCLGRWREQNGHGCKQGHIQHVYQEIAKDFGGGESFKRAGHQ
jgi:hypothetical protein